MKDRPCPIWGNMIIDCASILTGGSLNQNLPCHFYNPNTQQCVIFDISNSLQDIPQAISVLSFGLGPKKPPRVLFTDVEEYCKEIRADKEEIYRNIVRATLSFSTTKDHAWVTTTVMSSYTVGDQFISLDHPIGDAPVNDDSIKSRCINEGVAIIKQIRATCIDCLLECRGGTLVIKM